MKSSMPIIHEIDDILHSHNSKHTLDCTIHFDGDSTYWSCELKVVHLSTGEPEHSFEATSSPMYPEWWSDPAEAMVECLKKMAKDETYGPVVGPTINKWLDKYDSKALGRDG